MNTLVPFGFGSDLLPARHTRATRRQLDRMDARTELRIRAIENASDEWAAMVSAVGHVGKRAMYVVGDVTQTEQHVDQLVPLAPSRCQAVGDMTTFVVTELLADMADQMRRA